MSADGFSEVERAAIKERAAELRTDRRGAKKADQESEVLAKIADMPQPDRHLAERFHVIVTTAAPELAPKLWYGMPAYARQGKVVCYFSSAQKHEERYSSVGFSDQASLDDGAVWPTSYAVTELSEADEARLSALVMKAAS